MRVSPIMVRSSNQATFKGIMVTKSSHEDVPSWPAQVDYYDYNYYPFKDEKYSDIKTVEDKLPKSKTEDDVKGASAYFCYHHFQCKEHLSFTKDEYNQFVAVKSHGDDSAIDNDTKIAISMDDFLRIGQEINHIKESEKIDGSSIDFSVIK